MYNKKKLRVVINFVFVCFFFGHIILIGYTLKYPENQSVRVFKESVKDLDFPVYFKLCARELENDTIRYEKLGYKDYFNFYVGKSMFNKNLIGWNGHTSNGSVMGSIERNVKQ